LLIILNLAFWKEEMKNLLWSIVAFLCIPVIAQACLLNYSIKITAGSDQLIYAGQTDTDSSGFAKIQLVNSDTLIGNDGAVLENLTLNLNADPEVGIEFGFRSTATVFNLASEVLTFDAITNPQASASAGITLTDRNSNGATITGLLPNGKTHQAWYNNSSVYANLVSGVSISGNSQAYSEETSGMIYDSVTSIASKFSFRLSAGDSASGTSTFVVVPEPATLILLGLGSLILFRRK
jgi:hypothetical protein